MLIIRDLGLCEYLPIWQKMQDFSASRTDTSSDEIWLLQHPPVFTLGRNGKPEHLLSPGDIPVIQIDRGGQVTYHGPGQLIAYVLVDIRRKDLGVRALVTALEQAVVAVLAEFGVQSQARADAPGVYVENRKIAALGLRIKNGKSYHGLSLNLDMDLAPFQRINPCGFSDLTVTQWKDEVGPVNWPEIQSRLTKQLAKQLGHPEFMRTVNE